MTTCIHIKMQVYNKIFIVSIYDPFLIALDTKKLPHFPEQIL